MNSALEKLLPEIEAWPEEDQAAIAEFARELEAQRSGFYEMSEDEEIAVSEGMAEADRGEFATDAEISAIRQRYAGR